MRKFIGLGLALATGLVSTAALAQEAVEVSSDNGKAAVGADVGILLPLGTLGDVTGLMIGGLVKLEYPVSPAVEVTGRVGYFHGLSTEPAPGFKQSWSNIPIWAGARYFFSGTRDGAYAGGELGLNMISWKQEMPSLGGILPGGTLTGSTTEIGLNASVGYKIGDIDLRGSLHFLDIGHLGDTMGVGLTAGYSFAKF